MIVLGANMGVVKKSRREVVNLSVFSSLA